MSLTSILRTIKSKIKLKTAKLNLLDYIFRVWNDKNLIKNSDLINGYKYADIIWNSYLTNEKKE